jgi:hypothetical protein
MYLESVRMSCLCRAFEFGLSQAVQHQTLRWSQMKDWEAEHLAARTAQHIRALDKADKAMEYLKEYPEPVDVCTCAVHRPHIACSFLRDDITCPACKCFTGLYSRAASM